MASAAQLPSPTAQATPESLTVLLDTERALTRCAQDERDVAVLFRLCALIDDVRREKAVQ